MQEEHGWSKVPRVVVHDKATYMVNHRAEELQFTFAASLRAAKMRSWAQTGTRWMAGRFGDVYPHENCIGNIRRLLESKFVSPGTGETFRQFRNRMQKVEDYMNSEDVAAARGGGLQALCNGMRRRCESVVACHGNRPRN